MTTTIPSPDRSAAVLAQGERWLRAEGFPLAVPPQRRLRALFPRCAPLFLWIAGTALSWTLGWVALLEVEPQTIETYQEPSTEDWGLLALTALAMFVGPPLMLVIAWGWSRWQRHWPEPVAQVLGAAVWLVLVWTLGPGPARWLETGDPLLFGSHVGAIVAGSALLLAGYAGLGSMARWAAAQTVRELPSLIPMVAKVLPMVMLAVLFLFVNAEIWKVADSLSFGRTFAVIAVLAGLALVLLTTSIVEKSRRILGARRHQEPDSHDEAREREMVEQAGGPWPEMLEEADATGEEPPALGRAEWLNFAVVPVMIQFIQSALFSLLVFVFFVAFGYLAIPDDASASWINHQPAALVVSGVSFPVKAVLVKVSMVIGVFTGLSFAASSTSDPAYRQDFLDPVLGRLRRGVVLRHVYRVARGD